MKKKTITCHDINNKEFEIDVDKLNFRPSVYGLLVEDNKILLSKQWDGYDFPGGGVNLDETVEEALKREFIEETGLEIEVGEVVHVETSFFYRNSKKGEDKYWNCNLMYFLVKRISGELSADGADEAEREYIDMPEWVDIGDLDGIKFYNAINSPKLIKRITKK